MTNMDENDFVVTDRSVTNSDHHLSMKQPELSEWKCYLFGTGENGAVLHPQKGKEPNWFWRWVQYICFGNRWVKRDKGE